MIHILPYLILTAALSTGSMVYDNDYHVNEPEHIVSTQMTAGLELTKYAYLEFEAETKTSPVTGSWTYSPYQNDWFVRTGIKPLPYLTIEAEHVCYHPELPGADEYNVYYGGYNTLSIEFDSREMSR
jgi:hypothetical protein